MSGKTRKGDPPHIGLAVLSAGAMALALSGRATSFMAPFTVATVTALSGSARLGMAMLLIFFVVGLVILWRTPYPAAVVAD